MLLTIYFEKRACRKLKNLIIKPCVFRGDCLDIQDRGLCNNSPLVEAVNHCHKELLTWCLSLYFMERLVGGKLLKNISFHCHFQVI